MKVRGGSLGIAEEEVGKFPFDAWDFTTPSATTPTVTLKDGWKLAVHDLDVGGDATLVGTIFSRFSIVVKTDDYTITDSDRATAIVVNASTAKTMTLPTLADNQGRILAFMNKGSGEAVIDGEGAETIQGFASLYLSAGAYLVLVGDATEWKRIAGAVQPVTAEPSWGFPHFHFYDTGASDPGDANVHELDLSGEFPVGAKGVIGFVTMASGTVGDYVMVTNSAGTSNYGRGLAQAASTTAEGFFASPLTAARSIYYMANNARVTSQRIRTLLYFM